jgi:hypothetical protein
VLAFDKISGLPAWVSDTFAVSPLAGFSVRQLHSDDSETLFDAMRPSILNGIEELLRGPTSPIARSRMSRFPMTSASSIKSYGPS